ncbi:hypothetical protein B0T14DRAFT_598316 [Immersiella caudata]|uniref:Uncharacterized protein n=1 Tax=Immersiella caudata TaxID=314043 RepID=A0AA39XFD7_9PEZI|nr:hypothetical protein B0T14DRAFT_598316 [Immersiella caudata]
MSRRRQGVSNVRHGGHVYRLGLSTSEQPPVLRVSCKFSSKTENPEDVSITKDELLGFASVYHRIYQVPEKTRDRLTRWRKVHLRMVESWRMPFWNSKVDDQRLALRPQKPGIPALALGRSVGADDESDETIDKDEMDLDRSNDPAVNPRESTPASSPPAASVHPRLPSALRSVSAPKPRRERTDEAQSEREQAYAAQISPQTLLTELKAARDAITDDFLWFQRAAVTMHEKDPLKESLLQMSCAAAKSLGRASQAVENANALVQKDKPESAEEIAQRIAERQLRKDSVYDFEGK